MEGMTTIPIEDVKDWFGKDVIDTDGEKLGKLEDVLYDTEADAPAFAAVKSGTFSKHLTLVALDGASAGQSHLRVPVDKNRFKKAPSFDPEAELSLEDEASAYGYYGLEYRPAGDGARRLAKH
jgi:sporulation protein YlmC with PRC-barrel domain